MDAQGHNKQYWEGDLLKVTRSRGIIKKNLYSLLAEELCYFNSSYNPANIDLTQNELSTLCAQFKALSSGITASMFFCDFINLVLINHMLHFGLFMEKNKKCLLGSCIFHNRISFRNFKH